MNCPTCGTPLAEGAKFCGNCARLAEHEKPDHLESTALAWSRHEPPVLAEPTRASVREAEVPPVTSGGIGGASTVVIGVLVVLVLIVIAYLLLK